mmetsp:Transcript_10882/g.29085  ORF Transcript_10882/g.29085 Transcript_10882/m.29085 type:complete len:233 (+) Transcript_10882:38-736(+)
MLPPQAAWQRAERLLLALLAQDVLLLLSLLRLLELRFLLPGLLLLRQRLRLHLLGLHLVDRLDQDALVLVGVALGVPVEVVVDVLVDLLLLPVLPEEPPQNPLPPHPKHLGGHPRLPRAAALADARVPPLALGLEVLPDARAGMHLDSLADDEAVLDQLADVETRVGHRDLVGLIRVEPDAAPPALLDLGREALLQRHRHGASALHASGGCCGCCWRRWRLRSGLFLGPSQA